MFSNHGLQICTQTPLTLYIFLKLCSNTSFLYLLVPGADLNALDAPSNVLLHYSDFFIVEQIKIIALSYVCAHTSQNHRHLALCIGSPQETNSCIRSNFFDVKRTTVTSQCVYMHADTPQCHSK